MSTGRVQRSQLLGRESECGVLDRLLADVRAGESRSLVLCGEAGIGKTALLGYLEASASDLNLVRAAGVESEMELAAASLHQLCAPMLDLLERIPAPQRQALEIVFGLDIGPAPDRFLVALAALSLVSTYAEERPLLCVVDDAQWLDQASALTLTFVARRLLAEPIGIVFSAREPSEALQQFPQLEVRGLTYEDASELLGAAVRFKLDERVRDRIIAETRGNPLALLELPRGLTATQLAGGFGVGEAQALPERIEASFVRRFETLSDDARRLLLVAAAEPLGDPLLLWRAAERLRIGPAAADEVAVRGLLAVADQVTFRHPLVRSAVYGSAAPDDRRSVHRALAEATDRETDPDRRAWHLAAATQGPDEEIALELERSAGRAQARGGVAAAAAFLQRAVALSQDPARRKERALATAEACFQAGAFEAALAAVRTAEAGQIDEFQRARVDLLRGRLAFASGDGSDAPSRLLLNAAGLLEAYDLELARETYLVAWGAGVIAGYIDGGDVLLEICQAARALPPLSSTARPIDLLLDGLALLITDGRAAATPTLQRAAKALADMPVEDVLRWGWMATSASVTVWDHEGFHAICVRQVEVLRDAGAVAELPIQLAALGMARSWMGDFAGAELLAQEAENVAAATGSRVAPYALLRLRSMQGRQTEASAAIEQAEAGGPGVAAFAHWAAAVLYNGLARYEEAAASAWEASNTTDFLVSAWALPELVEAATRAGERELARDALERLADATRPCATDVALGIEARSHALLSDGVAAEGLYRDSIDRLVRTQLRPELARAHLLYGEWLRREGRRAEARSELRTAHNMFVAIGMEAFADRARGELSATGERVRKRTVETRDELTPQERQIAHLVRQGFSNPEIGTRLFLSPRTVEWHLHNVYVKLGISSRRELRGFAGELIPAKHSG